MAAGCAPVALAYAIKTEIRTAIAAGACVFADQKTMYGGRRIGVGDTVYLFASENHGGGGLVAKGVVTAAVATARTPGVERQTPRVSITVRRTAVASRSLGRRELKGFADWADGRPQTELNFKFYRQATDKIVGLSAAAAAYLETHFS